MRIQCNWMFWRSLTSAVSRAKSRDISPITRACATLSRPPSVRMRIMKYLSDRDSASSLEVEAPSTPCLRWV